MPYLIEIIYARRMVKQAIRLALLVTLVVLALGACSGGGSSAQEERAKKVHTIPEDSQTYQGKPLPAGDYVSEEFKPAMSFTLVKGWTRGGPELRDAWDIRDIDNDAFWLGFLNAEEVYDPDDSGELRIAPAPKDMVAWLQANPYLKTDKPKPTSVGGEEGAQFDAIVTGAPEYPECTGCPDLGLFHESAGPTWGVNEGEKLRFIVLENVKGQTVTIVVETSDSGFSTNSCPRRRRSWTA